MERELRKQQSLLVEAGMGVILFAVWRVISINLYLGFEVLPLDMVREAAVEFGISEKFFLIFMVVVFAGVLIWQLSIRLYIGLSAAADGNGKAKNWWYLVVTAILLAVELQFCWTSFGVDSMLTWEEFEKNQIISLCMELASAYVLLELLISGIRVKLLRIKMKE